MFAYKQDIGSVSTANLFNAWAKGRILEVGAGMNKIFPYSETLDIVCNADYILSIDADRILKEKFDTIIMSHVLEHVESDIVAIINCYNMLNVGGCLIVLSPGHPTGICTMKEMLRNGHIRTYNRERVTMLESKNFPVVHYRHVHYIHNLIWNRLKYVLKALNYPIRLIDRKSIYDRWVYRKLLFPVLKNVFNALDAKFTRKANGTNVFFVMKKIS